MRTGVRTFVLVVAMVLAWGQGLYADFGGGSRASFTRVPLAGAKYMALGGAAEAVVDDVYSLYWNPAGLANITARKRLSSDEIKKKARAGKIDEINEESLLKFSEDEAGRRVVEIGTSGVIMDQERYGAFAGVAFNLGPGVMGIGGSSIFSVGIPSYDTGGVSTGTTQYVAAMALVAYGWTMDIVSLGFTFKILYEDIADYRYMGFGLDAGVRVQILPILEVSLVIQDIGTGLFPLEEATGVNMTYDLGMPVVRGGVALRTESGFTVSASIIKKIDYDEVSYGIGLAYSPHEVITLYLGLTDLNITTGMSLRFRGFDISYGFSMDGIDDGFNHMVSLTLLL